MNAESPPSPWARWRERLFAPVDIAPLVWFRIAFGLIMAVEVWRYFDHGWIGRYFIQPTFMFKYYGFGWIQPWPGNGMMLHFLVLGILAGCIALGLFYRLASALFFLGFAYVFLLDEARFLNHFYLVCLYAFLLAVVPAHRAFSLDAWLRPNLRRTTVPAWVLWLLRSQICFVYFFGGVAKLGSDWLHGEPLRLWLGRRALSSPVLGHWLGQAWTPWFFSYGGLFFDLGITPFLLWRRTRWYAFSAAAVFNITNGYIFNIGIFPWLALGSTVILFSARLPHPISSLWQPPASVTPAPASLRRQRLALAFVGLYAGIQIFLPIRNWFYPGAVEWTEEGHRFAWRMKLRNKDALMTLYAHDPDTNETVMITMSNYITRSQYDQAASRPDMVQQLARHVAEDFRAQGHPHIQIRATVLSSLNGRTEQMLIQPDVDLAAEPVTLRPAPWIIPLTTPLSSRRVADDKAPLPTDSEAGEK
jgi:vitamin K-dependent gamma-carboxylase-like protein